MTLSLVRCSAVAVALCASLFALASDEVTVRFSPNGGVREATLARLAQVSSTLDVAMYSFSDKEIWQALNTLGERGVKVRLLLNKDSFRPSVTSCSACDAAAAKGVAIRYVNATMHHKFALADVVVGESSKGTLMTGSGNWSASSPGNFDEDFVMLNDDVRLLPFFHREFEFLWRHAQEYPSGTPVPADGSNVSEHTFNSGVYFTSSNMRAELTARNGWRFRTDIDLRDGVVGKTLVSALDGASRTIDIASAHFRRKDIFDAVQRASARGVTVRLVLDGQELDYLDSQNKCETLDERAVFLDECLALNSPAAEVRYKIYSHRFSAMTAKLLHSKYVIIDGIILFTGSFNLSYNSELNSFENLIRFDDEGVVTLYRENFEKLFGYGAGQLDALKASVAAAAGAGPCVFPPFSLTAPQIWELRSLYQRGACSGNSPR